MPRSPGTCSFHVVFITIFLFLSRRNPQKKQSAQIAIAVGAPPPATAAVPNAILNRAIRTEGMLTRTVLAVAVSAIATAENAKAVGSLTMAAVPRPCALPPCARPRAAGSFTLVTVVPVPVAMVVAKVAAVTFPVHGSGGVRTEKSVIVREHFCAEVERRGAGRDGRRRRGWGRKCSTTSCATIIIAKGR